MNANNIKEREIRVFLFAMDLAYTIGFQNVVFESDCADIIAYNIGKQS